MELEHGLGPRISAGEFLLDESRARQKLQQFRLVNPRRYVLELVKAAHLLGATRIEFELNRRELEMRFNGEPIEPAEIENLASFVFSERRTKKQRALRHLAIAVQAAGGLHLETFKLHVETANFRHGHPSSEELARPMMRLALKKRAWYRLLFEEAKPAELLEEEILQRHCAYASIPIFLNGKRISRGMELDGQALIRVEIQTEHERGRLWMTDIQDRWHQIEVGLMQHGVIISSKKYNDPLVGGTAIIDSDRLTTNLSQSEFVEDAAFSEVHDVVLVMAQLRGVIAYLEQLPPGHRHFISSHGTTIRRLVVRAHIAFARLGRGAAVEKLYEQFLRAVERLPIYYVANPPLGRENELVSIAELR
ncbi:MAG: hypothetical protein ACNA8W_04765, partial [Bradymonadaceae bacterium]